MTPWYILMTASAGAFWGLAAVLHGRIAGRAARALEVLLGLAGSASATSSVLAAVLLPFDELGVSWWAATLMVVGQYSLMVMAYRRIEAVIG